MADERSHRRREFDRMTERHRAEIERKRADLQRERKALDERMAKLRAEMEVAREEFACAAGVEAQNLARKYRDRFGEWPVLKGRKRRRRGFDGGEPVPVKPRPKPTPLVDGAEAPIE